MWDRPTSSFPEFPKILSTFSSDWSPSTALRFPALRPLCLPGSRPSQPPSGSPPGAWEVFPEVRVFCCGRCPWTRLSIPPLRKRPYTAPRGSPVPSAVTRRSQIAESGMEALLVVVLTVRPDDILDFLLFAQGCGPHTFRLEGLVKPFQLPVGLWTRLNGSLIPIPIIPSGA